MFWCAGCGQLIPPSYMELETPVDDDDFPDELLGIKTTDADGAPDDAEGVVDVPTHDYSP